MIGIVVVSHSRALAEAAVGLANEMVEDDSRPAIAVAAGLDETTFGTDAAAVADAIGSVDSPDGVLVLLDLGSAVLSAEMALEFLDADTAGRVVVSAAPLVEGLVAAVVQASTGADIGSVADEAMRGLIGKQDHLGSADHNGPPEPALDASASSVAPTPDASVEIVVTNAHGLHARPAARLVGLVRTFDATVTLTDLESGRGPVDAGSLSRVATLDARSGARVRVEASGPDAERAVDAVRALAERAFGDRDEPAAQVPTPGVLDVGGSGLDMAMGPAVVLVDEVGTDEYVPGGVDEERARSRGAVEAAAESIGRVRARTREAVGEAEAEIFDAQLALLSDRSLLGSVEARLGAGASAPEAWTGCLQALAADFESLADPYQRERAQDVRSVQRSVVAALIGRPDPVAARAGESGVLIVPELDAATAATLDTSRVSGVVTLRGGATGHGDIVAKSRGIPVITDVGDAAAGVHDGTLVGFDARTATFVVDPDEEWQRDFASQVRSRTDARTHALAHASEPAVTTDGCRVTVAANVNSIDDAAQAARQGAEGSGLVRTEVLFGQDSTRPSVERQTQAFLAL
ncbi:MAG: multiphosphoryl transfer protein, partial [Nocardioidaceae bacterium]|nr:multiphosphoryl transfer protein [Nocardioidaceae bacterium]